MCCPYECPPQMCSSNESLEECFEYDPCSSCPGCQNPCPPPSCPPRPCTPFPCPPRRPPRSCNPCPPPRCPPRPCSPCPPPRCPPPPCSPCPPSCCPCKVKGKFGLAYIVETPKNRCETPLGWQIEFEDTPSKISNSCKKMMQWVNCPPLGEFCTDAVFSGYPKKCARSFASNPKSCCYEDDGPPPCDCESEPKCCCRPKQQSKCCKPRPLRRRPCCCTPPQPSCCPPQRQSCCCAKQETRKRYEEPGCSCCKKKGNAPRGDDDSLDYVPDREVHYKTKNGRENPKKEQHGESKSVQHDQSHHGQDEETVNQEKSTSSIILGQLKHSDNAITPSKKVLYSKNSLLAASNSVQKENRESMFSTRSNALNSRNSLPAASNNEQKENCEIMFPTRSNAMNSKNNFPDETNSKHNDNQGLEQNMAQPMGEHTASPSYVTQLESEINIPVEDYNAFIHEGSPNKTVMKTNYKTLREKIRQAKKHQEEVIHQEAELMHAIEAKLKHEEAMQGKGDGNQNSTIQTDKLVENGYGSRETSQLNPNIVNKASVSNQLNPDIGSKTVVDLEHETAASEKQMDTWRSNEQVAETGKDSDIVGVKILIEVKQSKKHIEQGGTMQHELAVIKKASGTN